LFWEAVKKVSEQIPLNVTVPPNNLFNDRPNLGVILG
jgi:hypothetical protein